MIRFFILIFLLLPHFAFSQNEEEVLMPEPIHKVGSPQKIKMEIDLYDEKLLRSLIDKIDSSPISQLSDEEVKKMIIDNLEKTPAGNYFTSNEKFITIVTAIIKDKEALKGLISIFLKREEMKNYFLIWLALIVIGFFLKKLLISSTWPGLIQWVAGIYLNFTITLISFALFVTHFESEMKPILKIVLNHFTV